MNKYYCLETQKHIFRKYTLIPIRQKDIQSVRKWRNDQIEILRQKNILTAKDQSAYYNKVIKQSFKQKHPELILFSFLYEGNLVGYGGFVHINWNLKRAEISFLTNTSRNKNKKEYKKDFSSFLKIIIPIAFEEIKFNKLVTETFDIRPITMNILEKFGFKYEGRLKMHIHIKNSYFDSLVHGFLRKDFLKDKVFSKNKK